MKYSIPPRGLGTESYVVDTDERNAHLPELDSLLERIGIELNDVQFSEALRGWLETHGPDDARIMRMWAGSLFASFLYKLPHNVCEAAYVASNAAVELSSNLLAFEKTQCQQMIVVAEGWLAAHSPAGVGAGTRRKNDGYV